MPGLGPGIHDFAWAGRAAFDEARGVGRTHACLHAQAAPAARKAWMTGSSPAMTVEDVKDRSGPWPYLSAGTPFRRGAACAPGHAGGGEAVPRRARGGARLGRPPRLQGFFPKGAARRRTRKPEDIRPPATTSRARP